MANSKPALIYIPDISGFTKFVTETEIDHSTHIIEELLEIIIDANQTKLELSEIEGDAVLFYRFGQAPSSREIVIQSKEMFIKFHEHLKLYERDRVCQCGACSTAQNLTLKMVAHYGDLAEVRVRDKSKLLGEDMIVAHRLLKNEVNADEYLLLSVKLLDACTSDHLGDEEWVEMQKDSSSYDEIGEVNYCYTVLTPLHKFVPDSPARETIERTSNPIVIEKRVNAPIKWVYEIISNADYKPIIGGIEISKDENSIPRIGSKHDCILPQGTLHFETTEAQLDESHMIYAELASNLPILGEATFVNVLDKIDEKSTTFRVEVHYHPKNGLDKLKFFLFKIPFGFGFKKGVRNAISYAENNQPKDQNA